MIKKTKRKSIVIMDEELEEGITSGDEVILLKPRKPRVSHKVTCCKNKKCHYMAHTDPPKHFCEEDKGYCCSWCRLSNGKNHGNHCQKVRRIRRQINYK